MANRNFNRYQALEKEVKVIYAEVAIGASGAPTLSSAGLGVASVSRNSAGDYDFVLEDKYTRLMHFGVTQEAASAEDLTFQVKSEDVAGSTKTINFVCKAAAVETDPSSGSKLFIRIELKNSSVK